VPVGVQPDDVGLGERVGSSSDQVSVGFAGWALGVGATAGCVVGDGDASGAATSSRSVVSVALGGAAVVVGSSDGDAFSRVSTELSVPSSTSTGWVGCTNVSAEAFSGRGVAAPLPIGVGPPMFAATGTEISTRVPLA
jgi:hypothetical protein